MRKLVLTAVTLLALPVFALASVVMVIGFSLRAIVELWQR
jgi:hypothetical protein